MCLVVADLPTSHLLVEAKGMTGQIMDVINNMLIDLTATIVRLDQEKRVERIKQGLQNKKAVDLAWKKPGKGRNAAKWAEVQALMRKHPKCQLIRLPNWLAAVWPMFTESSEKQRRRDGCPACTCCSYQQLQDQKPTAILKLRRLQCILLALG